MSAFTPTTLTEQLHRRADDRLRRDIGEKTEAVWVLLKPFLDARADYPKAGCDNAGLWIGEQWRATVTKMQEVLTPLYRDREVKEFLANYDKLALDVEDLNSTLAR